jgi:hypothetical protein
VADQPRLRQALRRPPHATAGAGEDQASRGDG